MSSDDPVYLADGVVFSFRQKTYVALPAPSSSCAGCAFSNRQGDTCRLCGSGFPECTDTRGDETKYFIVKEVECQQQSITL